LATVLLLSVAVSIKGQSHVGHSLQTKLLYNQLYLYQLLLIARSTFSLGILAAFEFWITALNRELASGFGPPF
jgi:hypothetical protein